MTLPLRIRTKVEKGVPFNEYHYSIYMKNHGKKRNATKPKYPFEKMEIMDSFALPPHIDSYKKVQAFRMYANNYGNRNNTGYIVLMDNNQQWRCWRIK